MSLLNSLELTAANAKVPSVWRRLVNPAGGLVYHWRAARHSRTLWQPFKQALSDWLAQWQPIERRLVLIGPSAGYNLPLVQLRRYEVVSVLEPDPLARWLFARRLRRALGVDCPQLDFVWQDQLVERPASLVEFLNRGEASALLFCNILGQLVHLVPPSDHEQRLHEIRENVHVALGGRSWASFHDRVSGPLAPALVSCSVSQRWSDTELIHRAYATDHHTARVELQDHHSSGFLPEHLAHTYFGWQIEPGRYHLIEAVQHVAPSSNMRRD